MIVECRWDDENLETLGLNGLTSMDVEHAIENGTPDPSVGNLSCWPILFGRAPDGRAVAVMFEWKTPETDLRDRGRSRVVKIN